MQSTFERRDVVVVGAGPVGLLLALELTLAGADVIVLERATAPSTILKAMSVGPLGIEALLRRGFAPAIAAAEASSVMAMQQFAKHSGTDLAARGKTYIGHFAGLSRIRKDAQRDPDRRARAVDQHALEAMLLERATALGIEIRRGHEITGAETSTDGVAVQCQAQSPLRCAYLVGCDGGRSAVRKLAGFAFPGAPPSLTFYQAIATLDHPERMGPFGWNRTERGVFAYGPVPGRIFMLDFSGPPADRAAPVSAEEVESKLRWISGADVRVKALDYGARWTDNTRLVDTYRKGRVLLAGDAAHVHSPFGGQGLNLGLVDATNLGWKLAHVVRGTMPESLLDTYDAERRPVAQSVLENTLAQLALLRPDPQSGALRELFARLLEIDDVNRLIGEMMTGASVRYELDDAHDAVGRLARDQRSTSGATLYELMHDGCGVLLDATPDGALSRVVERTSRGVRCAQTAGEASLLVRPDGCVAWTAEVGRDDGLNEALERWWPPRDS